MRVRVIVSKSLIRHLAPFKLLSPPIASIDEYADVMKLAKRPCFAPNLERSVAIVLQAKKVSFKGSDTFAKEDRLYNDINNVTNATDAAGRVFNTRNISCKLFEHRIVVGSVVEHEAADIRDLILLDRFAHD
jgi:hypothetical protein